MFFCIDLPSVRKAFLHGSILWAGTAFTRHVVGELAAMLYYYYRCEEDVQEAAVQLRRSRGRGRSRGKSRRRKRSIRENKLMCWRSEKLNWENVTAESSKQLKFQAKSALLFTLFWKATWLWFHPPPSTTEDQLTWNRLSNLRWRYSKYLIRMIFLTKTISSSTLWAALPTPIHRWTT